MSDKYGQDLIIDELGKLESRVKKITNDIVGILNNQAILASQVKELEEDRDLHAVDIANLQEKQDLRKWRNTTITELGAVGDAFEHHLKHHSSSIARVDTLKILSGSTAQGKPIRHRASPKTNVLANLKVICFECEKATEPTMQYKGTDGEGMFRYNCPKCDNVVLIWEGSTDSHVIAETLESQKSLEIHQDIEGSVQGKSDTIPVIADERTVEQSTMRDRNLAGVKSNPKEQEPDYTPTQMEIINRNIRLHNEQEPLKERQSPPPASSDFKTPEYISVELLTKFNLKISEIYDIFSKVIEMSNESGIKAFCHSMRNKILLDWEQLKQLMEAEEKNE